MSRATWQPAAAPDGVVDPYLDWTIGPGADFEPAADVVVQHPRDFAYAIGPDAERLAAAGLAPLGAAQFLLPEGAGVRLACRVPLRHAQLADRSDALEQAWTCPSGVDPASVGVMAVIDDAINLAQARTRGPSGTRIDFAWVQDADAVPDGTVPFGRAWSATELDAAARDAATESDALRALGLDRGDRPGWRAMHRRLNHGTHVLDLAAGADPDAADEGSRIVAVQLPARVTEDTSGRALAPFALAGIAYALARTRDIGRALGRPVPLVVNLSYGLAGGSMARDGVLRDTLDALLPAHQRHADGGPVEIVLPAGNLNLAKGHARVEAQGGRAALSVGWHLPPDDATASYLEVWLPELAVLDTMTIAAPDLEPVSVFGAGLDAEECVAANGSVIARVARDRLVCGSRRILLAIAPTSVSAFAHRRGRASAPAGRWGVTVEAMMPDGEAIEAWVQRDDAAHNHRQRGRQSWLDDGAYRHRNRRGVSMDDDPPDAGAVRRRGSLSGLASHPATLIVGGCVGEGEPLRVAAYSGTGMPQGKAPHLVAACDRSLVRGGVLAVGGTGAARVAMGGTSVAAPRVARARLAQLRNVAIRDASWRDHILRPWPGAAPGWHPRYGDGYLSHPDAGPSRQASRWAEGTPARTGAEAAPT